MSANQVNVKTILIVEDEPAICEFCRRLLTKEGFDVDIAVNGKVAQAMIQNMTDNKQYDLCLVDIRMPEVNGMQLYQWMKTESPQLASRVIITTGSVVSEATMTFIQKTDKPFLPKPFTPAELRTVVRDALK